MPRDRCRVGQIADRLRERDIEARLRADRAVARIEGRRHARRGHVRAAREDIVDDEVARLCRAGVLKTDRIARGRPRVGGRRTLLRDADDRQKDRRGRCWVGRGGSNGRAVGGGAGRMRARDERRGRESRKPGEVGSVAFSGALWRGRRNGVTRRHARGGAGRKGADRRIRRRS